ncbi:MAG: hypothetical protein U2P89_00280 [Proteiniphilum sp.]|nr:hypothetical protein [Proteiniphilum sp.]MDY9917293.1 hypothetical protein [Proteiniphilum sp.]
MRKNIVLFGLIGILIIALGVNSCAPDYRFVTIKILLQPKVKGV